jgi:hypothetical protein
VRFNLVEAGVPVSIVIFGPVWAGFKGIRRDRNDRKR